MSGQIQVNYLHIIGEQQVEIMVLKEHIRQLEARLNGADKEVQPPVELPAQAVE